MSCECEGRQAFQIAQLQMSPPPLTAPGSPRPHHSQLKQVQGLGPPREAPWRLGPAPTPFRMSKASVPGASRDRPHQHLLTALQLLRHQTPQPR